MNLIEKAAEKCNLIFAPDYLGAIFSLSDFECEKCLLGVLKILVICVIMFLTKYSDLEGKNVRRINIGTNKRECVR